MPLSPHQDFGARIIGGWSQGLLPTQRLFSIGGLGSVHGYEFKEQNGNTLSLLNLEYALGWRNAFQVVGFFDAGHASFRNVVRCSQVAVFRCFSGSQSRAGCASRPFRLSG